MPNKTQQLRPKLQPGGKMLKKITRLKLGSSLPTQTGKKIRLKLLLNSVMLPRLMLLLMFMLMFILKSKLMLMLKFALMSTKKPLMLLKTQPPTQKLLPCLVM